MTQDQSRRVGRALMALSVVQVVIFLIGATRRSYLVIAVPMGVALGALAGLGFWVGYTMAHTDWDDPADYPPSPYGAAGDDDEVAAAEGAPPPEVFTP